ncbi:MAG: ABC transporter permease [Candidatus Mesenet longicola]|nr:MAG: ABC transporter permease [Candidatus Mesenet longicola]
MMLFYTMSIFISSGKYSINFLSSIGRMFIFFIKSIYQCFLPPYYFHALLKQVMEVGYFSLPIVGLASIFIGAIIVLQSGLNPPIINPDSIIPYIVVTSITRELGPVLIGLIIAGKVGAAIAAEIGTMRISEQIDALITLGVNPFKYLIAPRVIALIITLPILITCANLIGIYGGYLVAVFELHYSPDIYIKHAIKSLNMYDLILGLIKSFVFGAVISLVSCYYGYYCKEGARGVGVATTSAVVLSSIFIILLNYIITLTYS